MNKANSFSKKLNGNVDFGLIPLKLSDHTQFTDKNKYKDGNSISKIIKLQLFEDIKVHFLPLYLQTTFQKKYIIEC